MDVSHPYGCCMPVHLILVDFIALILYIVEHRHYEVIHYTVLTILLLLFVSRVQTLTFGNALSIIRNGNNMYTAF
jgi:hypothetical protein